MLFNSLPFLFLFLPACLALWFAIGRVRPRGAALFLAAASFFFYAWWNPVYVGLLAASTAFNFLAGSAIAHASKAQTRRLVLTGAVIADLVVLGYYKYWAFLLGSVSAAGDFGWPVEAIVLPIGISFFTFTQIAFLVDVYRGEAREGDPVHYALFVSFFPHLLAGPLLHHKEMMPQFAAASSYRLHWENLSVGLTIFIIGLIKKVVLADSIAHYAAPLFKAATLAGSAPTAVEAWGGALAYTFQLYFDFSGYSDMAIGAARMFGIRMPLNFHSPYKATSIIEFWRRWHITLSRFLRDYLYIALGGNRHGTARRYVNLFLTMLLGGLWHGAAWTFVAWGALHGIFLIVNHLWRGVRGSVGATERFAGTVLTFLCVVVGWVLFRAETFAGAGVILGGMAGLNGAASPRGVLADLTEVSWGNGLYAGQDQSLALLALGLVAFLAPNTQELMARFAPALGSFVTDAAARPGRLRWTAHPAWSIVLAVGFLVALSRMSGVSEFLYYQF